MSYRMLDDLSKRLQTGCFVPTAFGFIDPAKSIAIFTGTDEAQPITYGGQAAALNVIPYSASVARFGGFPGLGTYMYLYTYFPNALSDEGIPLVGRYKSITGQPNFVVKGPDNLPLPVNPQAMAYAPRGQWMVTETPAHSLVRINLADFSILPFDDSFYIPNIPFASHSASMAITGNGRYAAVASTEFSSLKVYDLSSCSPPNQSDLLASRHCRTYNYWQYVKSQVSGNLERITQLRFLQDGLLSFTAVTSAGTESYVLAPSDHIDSLLPYLGLGDSYASGQGAWNYFSGTDTSINKCHLSAHSYPVRLSGDAFSSGGHSVACSGARIADITNDSREYAGQVSDHHSAATREADGSEVTILHDFLPGYLAQKNFVTTYQPRVITVQAGGNDIGFKDIMLRCVSPLSSLVPPKTNPLNCYSSYEDRLELEQTVTRHYGEWVSLYKQLHQAAPAAQIYAIGYPQVIAATGTCALNVHISSEEAILIREIVTYLNSVIKKATVAAGVQYVDIADAFTGHELCAEHPTPPAMNGITAGTDAYGMLGQESFHPTAYGHELIEQAILHKTQNFTLPNTAPPQSPPEPPQPSSTDALLQAPKSDRPIKVVTPVNGAVTLGQNGVLAITLDGNEYGLKAGVTYGIKIGGILVGTVSSNQQGEITASITIPPGISSGLQTVSIEGLGQDGRSNTVTEVIYIPSSPSDYDGDGTPNTQDSCPAVTNSGVDNDHDGVDDACDTVLAQPTPLRLTIPWIDGRVSYTSSVGATPYSLRRTGEHHS